MLGYVFFKSVIISALLRITKEQVLVVAFVILNAINVYNTVILFGQISSMIEIEVEMETDVLAAETASNIVKLLKHMFFWMMTS